MPSDDDRPDDWPADAEWPPEVGWRAGDDPPPILGTGPIPPSGVQTLTWCVTVVAPLLLWTLVFWSVGLGRSDGRQPECGGLCLSPRQEVWFAGVASGVIAVPVATVIGAVAVALTAPARRPTAAIGMLLVDLCAAALVAAVLAEARPG